MKRPEGNMRGLGPVGPAVSMGLARTVAKSAESWKMREDGMEFVSQNEVQAKAWLKYVSE